MSDSWFDFDNNDGLDTRSFGTGYNIAELVSETAFDSEPPSWIETSFEWATRSSDSERDMWGLQAKQDDPSASFFDKLSAGVGKAADSVGRAYDKDPMKFFELGAKTLGGVYLADQKRDAIAKQNQAALDQQNNKAAIEEAERKRYSDSFVSRPTVARSTPVPLSRMDGSRVFNGNGTLNKG